MRRSALLWEDAETLDTSIAMFRSLKNAVLALTKAGEPLSSAQAHLLSEVLKQWDKALNDLDLLAGEADTIYPDDEVTEPKMYTPAWFRKHGIIPTVGGHEVI